MNTEIQETLSTEQKIIEAAKSVFMENGLDKTRMQDIAERAGISRTSLNYYFRTKENLFEYLLEQLFDDIVPAIEEILNKGYDFIDGIDTLIDLYDSKLRDNTFIPKFIFFEIQRNPVLVGNFLSKSAKAQNYLKLMSFAINTSMKADKIREIPLEEIITTVYGQLFMPYLVDPVLSEYWNHDETKRTAFFELHKTNTKRIIRDFLIPSL